MSGWAPRRFWSQATVEAAPGGWTVRLDGRGVKTPGKAPLVVPTPALARLIAAEWAAQGAQVAPATMPATRAANAALDKVAPARAAVAAEVARYAQTDLLCYRAGDPPALAQRQAWAWDPLLAWARARFGADLAVTQGVMPCAQPPAALAALAAPVGGLDAFRLAALHDLVALPGSLVIGLAAALGAFAPQALWQAARIDDDWQAELWGSDPEAEAAAALRQAAFFAALRFWEACAEGAGAPGCAPRRAGLTD